MKGRTVSLIIALALVNYLILSAVWSAFRSPNQPLPTPTRTPKPTFTRGAEARVSFVTATATEPPAPTATFTPLPVTPSATPTSAPTETPALQSPPASDTPVLTPPATSAPPPTATAPAATPTPPATSASPAPAATSFIHVVAAGESLSYIASKYGVTIQAIVEVNGLKSANQVFIGQRLIIPAPTAAPTAGPTRRTHVVKAGEFLSTIAQQYGVSMEAIMRANNITNADRIYAGQVLIIP